MPLRPLVGRLRRRLVTPQSFYEVPAAQALRIAYNVMLRRDPEPGVVRSVLPALESGALPRDELVQRLRGSEEFRVRTRFQGPALPHSLHVSRCEFIMGLPRARRILDIGGAHHASPVGALVSMGYPYPFDELTVVDLPAADRHPLYRSEEHTEVVTSHLGPVRYRYHSMADLSGYDDGSFDLVYSGQSIEHVTTAEAGQVLAGIRRLLVPGGHLALDTPNARACRLQQEGFIDPDHKAEYTSEEMLALLEGAGFAVVEAKGLNYLGASLAGGRFDFNEAAGNQGLYAEAADCYLLAYLAVRPSST